jgi:peptide/nickel transport system permease protein
MVNAAGASRAVVPGRAASPARAFRFVRRNPTLVFGLTILALMLAAALAAPWIAGDPYSMKPVQRFVAPNDAFWFGTDNLGRDVYARTVYGARVSLAVGLSVAVVAVSIGLVVGVLAGFFKPVEILVMRLMDGLMAIPAILLAIALISLFKGSVGIVIIAIVIPEVPRVARLVRSVVLATREQPYVEAAIASGTRVQRILWRHILPSTFSPLIVQATYICASAILIEAGLSFLGAGTPPEIPTWGNMIASSRVYLARAPWTVFCPGLALALVVLSINLVGDGLRDRLDPRIARRM